MRIDTILIRPKGIVKYGGRAVTPNDVVSYYSWVASQLITITDPTEFVTSILPSITAASDAAILHLQKPPDYHGLTWAVTSEN